MRILIVEDESRMAQTIQSILKKENFISDIAEDGETGLDCGLSGIYDLIILDVMLPLKDGFQVLEELRKKGIQTPILLLTARGTVADRIEGLNKGADYYLVKPFSAGELIACIRALLRRPHEFDSNVLRYGDLALDVESGRLSCGDSSVILSRRELELLRYLMRSDGNPATRESLVVKVWGFDESPESNVVDAYMSFLRKKILFLHSKVEIVNIRRVGYYLRTGEDKP